MLDKYPTIMVPCAQHELLHQPTIVEAWYEMNQGGPVAERMMGGACGRHGKKMATLRCQLIVVEMAAKKATLWWQLIAANSSI
jgi:hypothetical protein